MDLQQGEFLFVAGGTGAGKSSLLRMLASEESPNQGSVRLFGYDLARVSPSTLRSIRQAIGYIPQNLRLIHDLSVYDNIFLSLKIRKRSLKNAPSRIDELLNDVGLLSKRESKASTLSGGEAQRVAIARALVRTPDLIVADEPTGAQDKGFGWKLIDLFLKANSQGAGVILATHDNEVISRVQKSCAVLRGGHIRIEGSGVWS